MEPGAQGQRRGRKRAGPEAAAARGDWPVPAVPTGDVSASDVSAALAQIVARRTAEMKAAVDADFAQWLAARQMGGLNGSTAAQTERSSHCADPERAADRVVTHGRFRYRPGFEDVWLGDAHYDLRNWRRAQLCLQFLVELRAFDAGSARHLLDEIDPYVRANGDFLPSVDLRIHHYFNDEGKLRSLCREIVRPAGRNGRYFLKVE